MKKQVRQKANNFQNRYRDKLTSNWKVTIKNSREPYYTCYNYGIIFQNWRVGLEETGIYSELIREIQTDSIVSLIFANQSMYRSAMMSLRSLLENSLKEIYFHNHPVELGWWIKGDFNTELKELMKFIFKLESIKKYNKEKKLDQIIYVLYRRLSKFVHAHGHNHMYSPMNLTTFSYDKVQYNIWASNYRKVCKTVDILFLLFYHEEFYNFSRNQKNIIKSLFKTDEQSIISNCVGINDFFVLRRI